MREVKLTAGQRKDLRDGKTIQVTIDGITVNVTRWLIEYAKQVLATGGELTVLGEVVGENRMEEIKIKT